jgi:hypothetical protein
MYQFYIQAVTEENVEKVRGCEYFLKALYMQPTQHIKQAKHRKISQ